MTRATRSRRSAAQQTEQTADQVLDWLRSQRGAVPDCGDGAPDNTELGEGTGTAALCGAERAPAGADVQTMPAPQARGERRAAFTVPLRLPHPDWLHHRLGVTGAAAVTADFHASACGAGTIPWTLDLDRVEEDLFHLLVVPPAPQRRRLSLVGARVLASQLRDAVAMRHVAAIRRVERSQAGAAFQACPLDLHALVPVPAPILRLGPDHPDALAWLWTHWGTTDALRHVALAPAPVLRTPLPAGTATIHLTFWSTDWTPWRALVAVAMRWPALRFDVRPTYDVL